jgi:hypothetical protein
MQLERIMREGAKMLRWTDSLFCSPSLFGYTVN